MLIVWDYFGVLAQDSFWYTADRIADGRGASDKMKKLHHETDLGEMSWDEYTMAVAQDLDIPLDQVRSRYQDHRINQDNILAIRLLNHHTHVLLSNASSEYLKPIIHRLGLDLLFKEIFVSSDIGFAKPDERAFTYVLSKMKVDEGPAIMIDDSASNIESAVNLGMKGIVYKKGMNTYEEIIRLIGDKSA